MRSSSTLASVTSNPRMSASVRALCERFGAEREIRPLLVRLASEDDDRNFRRLAGQALSWLPGADPEHLPDIGE